MERIAIPFSEFRQRGINDLENKWSDSALVCFVFIAICSVASCIPFASIVLTFFVTLPLNYGMAIYFLRLSRRETLQITDLFEGYRKFGDIFLTILLRWVYIFLWSLLFIIPGIVKIYAYSMTYYIVHDTDYANDQAIDLSINMMYGNKFKLFVLDWSFIGWSILCVLTFGIGFFWLVPYMLTTRAEFYKEVKERYEASVQAN